MPIYHYVKGGQTARLHSCLTSFLIRPVENACAGEKAALDPWRKLSIIFVAGYRLPFTDGRYARALRKDVAPQRPLAANCLLTRPRAPLATDMADTIAGRCTCLLRSRLSIAP